MLKLEKICTPLVAILIVAVFYLLFPTCNSTADAYNYASQVRYGVDLFQYHHLLQNFAFYWILKPFHGISDVLKAGIFLNSIFAILNLFILSKILKLLNFNQKEIAVLLLIAGFSFNSWRFATENEVYILPISFSLVASYFLLKFIKTEKQKFVVFSGFFSAFACLFHQIHFFWWLGILVGLIYFYRNFKTVALYSFSAILVPIVYATVIFSIHKELNFSNFFRFIFHDYISGSAKNELGLKNFAMLGIALVRSFFQVHGNMLFLVKKNWLFLTPIPFFIFLVYKILALFFQKKLWVKRQNVSRKFLKIHILILLLQVFFAFLAVGNVEFLVMLPILLTVTLFYFYKVNFSVLKVLAVTLFVWNFVFAILPNHFFTMENEQKFVDFAKEHPHDFFVAEEGRMPVQYFYDTGIDNAPNILKPEILENPALLNQLLKRGNVYTNLVGKPAVINRSTMIQGENNLKLDGYKLTPVGIYPTLFGNIFINKISVK